MSVRVVIDGEAGGPVLASTVPLSLWGGVEPSTGEIIDRHHPLQGRWVTGRVLVLPAGRGSSSASAVLLETLVAGTGPAAIVLGGADDILASGIVVAQELHGLSIPLLVADAATMARAGTAAFARIHAGGRLELDPAPVGGRR